MHVRRALALALAVPLLLAGCSEDEPTPKIPEPTSSSPTPEPTESETAEPESAEEFIRRWAAIEAEMENTGETAEYLALSGDCEACTSLAQMVERWYKDGGYIKWDGWRIRKIVPRPNSETDFVVRVVSTPTEYKERSSGELKSFPGGSSSHVLTLEERADGWVVTDKVKVAE